MARGFLYLVAIIDVYSRYVVSWRLSNTLDADFCIEVLEEALRKDVPEIFNTDQEVQFTSEAFTGLLQKYGVRISMDGKGSYNDNLFIERLWRSVKYEEVYLKGYQDGRDARIGIGNYFRFYNEERPHQALGYRTPAEGFTSIPFGVTEGHMIESLTPDPLIRMRDPLLTQPPFCPNDGDHLTNNQVAHFNYKLRGVANSFANRAFMPLGHLDVRSIGAWLSIGQHEQP